MAVLAGSAEVSADVLGETEATGQLSAQNIIFLRVRRLAGLRNFREVMDLPELATILSIRRPVRHRCPVRRRPLCHRARRL